MTFEARTDNAGWGERLPAVVDYDQPTWSSDLTQDRTPYGLSWVDGLGSPKEARLTLRVYISAVTVRACDRESGRVLSLLRAATGFRDRRRHPERYLITQGLIGEPRVQDYRGGTTRLLTVTLALRDPYWHLADDDDSTDLYPI